MGVTAARLRPGYRAGTQPQPCDRAAADHDPGLKAATADLKSGIIEQRKQVAVEAGELAGKQIDYAVREITWLVALVMSPVLAVALLGVLLVRRLPPRRTHADPHRRVASNGPKTAA